MEILTAGTGITILFKRVPSKLVSCKYYIGCGSVDEILPEQEGLCHALEHMLFQGTNTRTWRDISTDFRKVGSYSNAETDFRHTAFEMQVAREHFEPAFEVLADQVYNSTMPEDRWKIEKGTIISEIEEFLDSPDELLGVLSMKDAFGPNYRDPIGTIENIKNADVEHLKYFKDTFYRGRNVFLSISGDFTEKQLLKIVDKYDKWQPRRCKVRQAQEFKFDPANFLTVKAGIQQSYISWIQPIKRYNRIREEIALDIGMDLLYNYLYEDIVWDKGLCYGIAPADFADIEGCECISIDVSCSSDKVERMLEEVPKSIHKFFETQITSDKIEESRMAYMRRALEAAEDPDSITSWMAHTYLDGHKKDPFDEVFKGATRIKDTTIKSILTECLTADNKLCVMVGDNEGSFNF